MKKLLLLAFFTISTLACKENQKASNQNNKEITFKDLDLIKAKPENEIEEFLKKNKEQQIIEGQRLDFDSCQPAKNRIRFII